MEKNKTVEEEENKLNNKKKTSWQNSIDHVSRI